MPIGKIKSNQQLKVLDLSHNQILRLPQNMFEFLPNVTKVVFDYNEISDFNLVININNANKKLQVLSISNNKLMRFPVNVSGPLAAIHLNDNKIKAIPTGSFQELPSLRAIYLHQNQIASLPLTLQTCWPTV